jgi:hypothetical protein
VYHLLYNDLRVVKEISKHWITLGMVVAPDRAEGGGWSVRTDLDGDGETLICCGIGCLVYLGRKRLLKGKFRCGKLCGVDYLGSTEYISNRLVF